MRTLMLTLFTLGAINLAHGALEERHGYSQECLKIKQHIAALKIASDVASNKHRESLVRYKESEEAQRLQSQLWRQSIEAKQRWSDAVTDRRAIECAMNR